LAKIKAGKLEIRMIQMSVNEIADEIESSGALGFVNIRETAGWSKDAKASGPKMAALIAAAAEPTPDFAFVSLTSEGVTLLYGRDEQVIEAADQMADFILPCDGQGLRRLS